MSETNQPTTEVIDISKLPETSVSNMLTNSINQRVQLDNNIKIILKELVQRSIAREQSTKEPEPLKLPKLEKANVPEKEQNI